MHISNIFLNIFCFLFLEQIPHPAGLTAVKVSVCVPVPATVRTTETAALIITVRKKTPKELKI